MTSLPSNFSLFWSWGGEQQEAQRGEIFLAAAVMPCKERQLSSLVILEVCKVFCSPSKQKSSLSSYWLANRDGAYHPAYRRCQTIITHVLFPAAELFLQMHSYVEAPDVPLLRAEMPQVGVGTGGSGTPLAECQALTANLIEKAVYK